MKTRLVVTMVVLVAIAFAITSGWRLRVTKHSALTDPQDALPVIQNESVASNTPEAPSTSPKQRASDEIAPAKTPPVVEQFADWAERAISQSGGKLSETKIAEGEALAKARQEALYELIKTDPQKALEFALPNNVRQQLPEEITRHFEERVSGPGDYQVIIGDDFSQPGSPKSTYLRQMTVNGTSYEASVYGAWLNQGNRSKVLFVGIAIGNRLALHSKGVRRFEIGEVPPPGAERRPCPVSGKPADVNGTAEYAQVGDKVESFCGPAHLDASLGILASGGGGTGGAGAMATISPEWSQGPKQLLYIRVNFSDDATIPATEQEAQTTMNAVNNWYKQASYDTTEITTTVTPVFTIGAPKSLFASFGAETLWNAALSAAATQGGVTTNGYHLYIIRSVPVYPGIGGNARVGSSGAWVGSASVGVHIHELGHNYGLYHASRWAAIGGIIGRGSAQEYGDAFDAMGTGGTAHFNAPHKYLLNWLPEAFAPRVTASGVYRIYALDVPTLAQGKAYTLRVQKDSARDYWIEARQPSPGSGNDFSKLANDNGVFLHWNPNVSAIFGYSPSTMMLDMDPHYTDPAYNTALQIGRTFSDPIQGVHITPISQGNDNGHRWVDVAVNLGHFPNNNPPSVALTFQEPNGEPAFFSIVPSIANGPLDPDGDTLAYYWDYGQAIDPFLEFPVIQPNSSQVEHVWRLPSQWRAQVVRCIVSDRKGGVTTVQHFFNSSSLPYIHGRITVGGAPLEGVFLSAPQSPDPSVIAQNSYFSHYGFTDSDGYYFVHFPSGTDLNNITLAPSKNGYAFTQQSGSGGAVNFAATENLSRVSISVATGQIEEDLGGSAYVTVSRTGPTDQALTVAYLLSGTAVAGSDYHYPSIQIPAGASSANIPITPIDDDVLNEGSETVTIWLNEAVTQFGGQYTLTQPVEVTITISAERSVPIVSVSSSAASVWESGSGSIITVSRGSDTASAMNVPFSLAGTATRGVDYEIRVGGVPVTSQSFVVTIPAGSLSTTFELLPINDTLRESDETVTVNLSSSPAYRRGPGRIMNVPILEDDFAVQLASSRAYVSEHAVNEANVIVSLTKAMPFAVTVNLSAQGGAMFGTDYQLLRADNSVVTSSQFSVLISAGSTTATFKVKVLDDAQYEGAESIVLEVLPNAAYQLTSLSVATIHVQDNEGQSVGITTQDGQVTEASQDTERITVTRAGPVAALQNPVSVHVRAISLTATHGQDFEVLAGNGPIATDYIVTIPANELSADFHVRGLNDVWGEPNETFKLEVLDRPDYVIGTPAFATITVTPDGDSSQTQILMTASAATVKEGASEYIVLHRSGGPSGALPVTFYFDGSASQNIDFELYADGDLIFDTVTIPANMTQVSIEVRCVSDEVADNRETVELQHSGGSSALMYIIDAKVTVAAQDAVAGESPSDPGTFTVTRTGPFGVALVINYTLGGTAVNGQDYAQLSGTVTIPANSASATVTVTPSDDAHFEGSETVTLQVGSSAEYIIGSASQATVTIADNDSAPSVTIASSTSVIREAGSAAIGLLRAGNLNGALTVQIGLAGEASPLVDYQVLVDGTPVTISGSQFPVVFPANQSSGQLVVQSLDDSTSEHRETITLTVLPDPLYAVGGASSYTINVLDNEAAIVAGHHHSLCIRPDMNGRLWAWGNNQYGQLGDGTTIGRLSFVEVVGLSGVISLSAATAHSLAVKSDGTVWAWGNNSYGRLGDGTTLQRLQPVQLNTIADVVEVAAGNLHSIALKSDGTVWTWGHNSDGQLGDGTTVGTYRPFPAQVTTLANVVSVSAGGMHSVALKADGTVWAWGANADGQVGDNTNLRRFFPVQVQGISGVRMISARQDKSHAVKHDGTAWSWGYNTYGALGDGTTTTKYSPVAMLNASNVKVIAGGYYHTLVLKNDGTVLACGNNSYGQLGDGTTTMRTSLVPSSGLLLNPDYPSSISAGYSHSLGSRNNMGSMFSWGYNGYGQLGINSQVNQSSPVYVWD